jgi:hypothetical protein
MNKIEITGSNNCPMSADEVDHSGPEAKGILECIFKGPYPIHLPGSIFGLHNV